MAKPAIVANLGTETVYLGPRRALVVGAAIAAIAAGGARAAIRPIGLDGCSDGCGAIATAEENSAQVGADAEITLSLIGGRAPGALAFEAEAMPTALANGFPWALSPNRPTDSGPRDLEFVFSHPDEIAGPASFMSVASLTQQLTLSEILSDSHAYFVAQSEALSLLPPPDLGDFPKIYQLRHTGFWTDYGETVRNSVTPPKFPWMEWLDSSSGSSATPRSQ